jgi:hypothetical protein
MVKKAQVPEGITRKQAFWIAFELAYARLVRVPWTPIRPRKNPTPFRVRPW